MKCLALIILAVLLCPVLAAAEEAQSVGASSPLSAPTYYQNYEKRAQETHDKQLEIIKKAEETHQLNMMLIARHEKLLDGEEANNKRFEKILSTWERQQEEYQTYLNSLKGSK